jgi:hypothetical protein
MDPGVNLLVIAVVKGVRLSNWLIVAHMGL